MQSCRTKSIARMAYIGTHSQYTHHPCKIERKEEATIAQWEERTWPPQSNGALTEAVPHKPTHEQWTSLSSRLWPLPSSPARPPPIRSRLRDTHAQASVAAPAPSRKETSGSPGSHIARQKTIATSGNASVRVREGWERSVSLFVRVEASRVGLDFWEIDFVEIGDRRLLIDPVFGVSGRIWEETEDRWSGVMWR